MTIESWKQEFYPVEATAVSAASAVQHSLNKWRGLTGTNLEKHGLHASFLTANIVEGETFAFNVDASTCALCAIYHIDPYDPKPCRNCPLYKQLGHKCDDRPGAPFREWRDIANPRPMIEALEKTVAMLEAENAEL